MKIRNKVKVFKLASETLPRYIYSGDGSLQVDQDNYILEGSIVSIEGGSCWSIKRWRRKDIPEANPEWD